MSTEHPCDHDDCPRDWCYRDPNNWDYTNPSEIQVKPNGTVMFTVRFPKEDFYRADDAADKAGMPFSEFVKQCINEALRKGEEDSPS